MRKELDAYQATGQLLEKMRRLERALFTIQPTSVEAERCFSVAGLFLTKLRNRMSDITIDNLVFMKHQLRNKK